jgi:biopolymer transport protein ExbD
VPSKLHQPEINGGRKMRFRTILTLVSLLLLFIFAACLTVAVSTEAIARPKSTAHQPASERGSLSGRISAIGDASFSVDVKKSENPVTVEFLVDDATKVQGKLEVGAAATVDYRTDGNSNIAVNVVVQPATSSN